MLCLQCRILRSGASSGDLRGSVADLASGAPCCGDEMVVLNEVGVALMRCR